MANICHVIQIKLNRNGKHFSEFLPTGWRQKSTGIDTEQNYVTVRLCILATSPSATIAPSALSVRAFEMPVKSRMTWTQKTEGSALFSQECIHLYSPSL